MTNSLKISLKVVLVGYGAIGKRHFQNLQQFTSDVIICSKQKSLKNSNKTFPILTDCLKQNPDVGLISNITNQHIETSKILAKANCHLFIEKPLSHSEKDIKDLIKLVKKKNLTTLIGCNLRFHPCLIKVKNLLSTGKIGKIISVLAENGSYLPDWHADEDYSKTYAARRDLGGGVVLTSIHELDYLFWLFGNISEVFSISGKYSNLKVSADDLSAILLKFKNNVVGEIHLDYFQKSKTRTCKIIGTKGIIECDLVKNTVNVFSNRQKKWKTILKLKNFDLNSTYVDELNHFFNCISKRKKTINTIDESFKILQISLAILESSKKKKVIKIK